jgi:hypothetical protein
MWWNRVCLESFERINVRRHIRPFGGYPMHSGSCILCLSSVYYIPFFMVNFPPLSFLRCWVRCFSFFAVSLSVFKKVQLKRDVPRAGVQRNEVLWLGLLSSLLFCIHEWKIDSIILSNSPWTDGSPMLFCRILRRLGTIDGRLHWTYEL